MLFTEIDKTIKINVVTLVATTPRLETLLNKAIPSIVKQTKFPKAIVVVTDKFPLSSLEEKALREACNGIELQICTNSRTKGAAGSWNTGIDYICNEFPDSYIAIIDDDDTWEVDHLSECISNSDFGTADVVLSGIRVITKKGAVAENVPESVSVDDFLIGNPGWQGSNTFVKASVARQVGGFTDGLISCNDRDFAIKVLAREVYKFCFTKKVTVNWYCNQFSDALSAPGSFQKLRGCAQFLKLHSSKMTKEQKSSYFNRAHNLFLLSKKQIQDELEQLGDFCE